jgi:hypothetical protein
MHSGQKAIEFLAAEVKKNDSMASSHWQKYHSSFQFTGSGFEGLKGFGGYRKPRGIILSAVERLLQARFRDMGGAKFSWLDQLAYDITQKQNRAYDLDVLRQVLTISFLYDHSPPRGGGIFSEEFTGAVIGDGFGSMTSLLLASRSACRVVLVNLSKTLLVDLWFLKLWMGNQQFDKSVDLVNTIDELSIALGKPIGTEYGRVIAIQAKDHSLLIGCPANFVVNIASMQEMNPPVIASYFDDMRSIAGCQQLMFYCCNREEKFLPDGTVTRFRDYPWNSNDDILLDELCPWHQQYYSFNPPFFRPYDGPIRHRLAVMANHLSDK